MGVVLEEGGGLTPALGCGLVGSVVVVVFVVVGAGRGRARARVAVRRVRRVRRACIVLDGLELDGQSVGRVDCFCIEAGAGDG